MSKTRRVVLCLLLLPCAILMATKLKSQSRGAAAKTKSAAPATEKRAVGGLKPLSPVERAWVDSAMKRMTVDEKVGQLLFTTFHGTFTSTESAEFKKLV